MPTQSETESTLKGDIAGGLTAAFLALPVSIVVGSFTLEALGRDGFTLGIVSGIWGLALGAIILAILGTRSTGVNVPRSVAGFFVAALLFQVIMGTNTVVAMEAGSQLAGVFLFLALTGLIQTVIGLTHMGGMVKYCPQPVLAGFLNAVGILLFVSQIGALLGVEDTHSIRIVLHEIERDFKPLNLVVVAVTGAIIAWPPRFTHRIPSMVSGVLVGTVAYHLLHELGLEKYLGSTIGSMPEVISPPFDIALKFYPFIEIYGARLPDILAAAFGLAIIGSLDHLLSSKAYEAHTGVRLDTNKELAKLGATNTILPCLGCIPVGINLTNSLANHNAGGKSRWSLVVIGITSLVAILLFGWAIAWLPRVVVAVLLITLALRLIDFNIVVTLFNWLRGKARISRSHGIDLAILIIVAGVAIAVGVANGVAVGIVIAVGFFIATTSRSVVRRVYRTDAIHSRRSRPAAEMEQLDIHGNKVVVLVLEGIVFFGTADHLLDRIDELLKEDVTHIILDMKRVNYIDSTGARIFVQLAKVVRESGRQVLVSHMNKNHELWEFMEDTGVVKAVGSSGFFDDTDHALEKAENDLLLAVIGEKTVIRETPLSRITPMELLNREELALLSPQLEKRIFNPGEHIFKEGDAGDELFIISEGSASVYRAMEDNIGSHRLVTFGQGTVFGEMALLDAQPRSASVRADGRLTCYVMSRHQLDDLVAQHHAIAVKMLISLSRELGRRLRSANQTINSLQT
ncbi:MAG: SLC26A/SulP transporter family protein [Burkholderiales bacterium]